MKTSTLSQSPIERATASILRQAAVILKNAAINQTEFTADIITATAAVIASTTALVAATPATVQPVAIEAPKAYIIPIEETEAIIAAATIEDNEEPLSARDILTERYFNAQDELAEIAAAKKIMDDEEKAAKKAAKAKMKAIVKKGADDITNKLCLKAIEENKRKTAFKPTTMTAEKYNEIYEDYIAQNTPIEPAIETPEQGEAAAKATITTAVVSDHIETLPSSTTFVKNMIKLINDNEIEKAWKRLQSKSSIMYTADKVNFQTYCNNHISEKNTVMYIYNLDSAFVILADKYTLRKNATSIETFFVLGCTATKEEALAAVAAYGSAA